MEKISKVDNVSLQQIFNGILLLKYRYLGSFPSDYVPIHAAETFAVIKTQPSTMQGEDWITIATSRHKMHFADPLGRPSFLTQQYKQMMPQPLQSQCSVCGFHTIYVAFHLFKFLEKEVTEVHDVNVL